MICKKLSISSMQVCYVAVLWIHNSKISPIPNPDMFLTAFGVLISNFKFKKMVLIFYYLNLSIFFFRCDGLTDTQHEQTGRCRSCQSLVRSLNRIVKRQHNTRENRNKINARFLSKYELLSRMKTNAKEKRKVLQTRRRYKAQIQVCV